MLPMSRLLLWQRFLILGFLTIALTGLPTYVYLEDTTKVLDIVRNEQRGITPLQLVMSLYKSVQDDRGLAVQLLSGVKSVIATRAAKQGEIDEQVAAIDSIAGLEPWGGNLYKLWQDIKHDLEQIAVTVAQRSVSAMETRKHHHEVIAKIHKFRELLAYQYKLSLDPEATSFHIMKVLIYDVVKITDPLGLIRGFGADVLFRASNAAFENLAAKTASADERVKLIQLVATARQGLSVLSESVNIAMLNNPQWQDNFVVKLQHLSKVTNTILKLTDDEIIDAKVVRYDFIDYRKTASDAIDVIDKFNTTMLLALTDIMAQRLAILEQKRLLVLLVMLLLAALVGGVNLMVVSSILLPMSHLMWVMHQLAGGNFNARASINSPDEFGKLAEYFNRMVNEREGVVNLIRAENEQLNSSVLLLVKAVAQLSQKDLTTNIPLTMDLTKPLSEALNTMVVELTKMLQRINDISVDITQAAVSVQEQADLVSSVARSEREQVEKTASELDSAAAAMLRITKLAQSTNTAADKATQTTEHALATVATTLEGIERTREVIREAGSRIELLGIHSQEISEVVDLIGGIARRTQILAVSASMHAASAGEAGQGFQVIANEVQRLAETAQQAAAKIGNLLNNIQTEVTDTVTTMNNANKQVTEGSRLAERAGEQMRLTKLSTAELVASVQMIAQASEEQAQASVDLLNRAHSIRKSTQLTNKQLRSQTAQTENLLQYARGLLSLVQIFRLPA